MKIEQNIVTGGMSRTRTPIFRFRIKLALLEPESEARHIAHCAETVSTPDVIRSRAVANNIKIMSFFVLT